jgi:hypothetical protein
MRVLVSVSGNARNRIVFTDPASSSSSRSSSWNGAR